MCGSRCIHIPKTRSVGSQKRYVTQKTLRFRTFFFNFHTLCNIFKIFVMYTNGRSRHTFNIWETSYIYQINVLFFFVYNKYNMNPRKSAQVGRIKNIIYIQIFKKCRPRPPAKATYLLTHVHGDCIKKVYIYWGFKTDGCNRLMKYAPKIQSYHIKTIY